MTINYFEPISRGWNRMVKALFKPFDISKRFVVGFTAFLANLLDSDGGSGYSRLKDDNNIDFNELFEFPLIARDWLLENISWAILILFGIMLIFALIILLTWLSSRGKFMFLDNVIHNRALIAKPWYEFKKEGNSLFLWRVAFGFICFFIFIMLAVVFFVTAYDFYDGELVGQSPVLYIIGFVLLVLMVIIVIAYISRFLEDFVIPIMYKYNITATEAWKSFLPLFSKYWLYFILYGLLIFFMAILVFIAIVFLGLFTCCIGFIFLIIPYISSVITLPISYFFRSFSVEFLEQFGPDFKIFPDEEIAAAEKMV